MWTKTIAESSLSRAEIAIQLRIRRNTSHVADKGTRPTKKVWFELCLLVLVAHFQKVPLLVPWC